MGTVEKKACFGLTRSLVAFCIRFKRFPLSIFLVTAYVLKEKKCQGLCYLAVLNKEENFSGGNYKDLNDE